MKSPQRYAMINMKSHDSQSYLLRHSPEMMIGKKVSALKWKTLSLDTWFWEVVSVVFSLGCFIAILCVLLVYDQKAMPSFPHGLTLNTIVSLLATGCKSSLLCMVGSAIGQWKRQLSDFQLIDDASRGPLGSLMVLVDTPRRGRLLVSLGAIITILALGVDPFMQQILQYPTQQVVGDSEKAIAKQAVFPFHPANNTVDMTLQNAARIGLWSNGDFQVDPACPTGNCTFPSFLSTGWCSKCANVTADTTVTGCYDLQFNTSDHSVQHAACNFTFADGSWVSHLFKGYWSAMSGGTGNMFGTNIPVELIARVNDDPGPFVNQTILGVEGPYNVFAYLGFEYKGAPKKVGDSPGEAFRLAYAQQCVISMCARTYDISVSDGVPSIKTSEPDWGGLFTHHYDRNESMTCWKPGKRGPVDVTGRPVNDWNGWQWSNADELAICPITDAQSDGLVGPFLTGSEHIAWFYNATTKMWEDGSSWSGTYDALERMATSEFDLSTLMENIAASLTKYSFNTSNQTIHGNPLTQQVYVSVNWVFLILPIIIMVLSILFLLFTVLINRKKRISLWKSSLLPLVYHGMAERLHDDEHTTISMMQYRAQSVDVRFQFLDRRLTLHEE